ncbi:MAG: TetR/AcrR family transcriptional regulator [Roseibium album]|uniref:TetR/AcrR family transcriptional regulator n=1 Tax=Roseibium album TaxID=311410 RepID=UPI0018CB79B0|nr:AcrR family transcriptional regulator [Labrenzia sp. EL_162]MBG6160760.1 AcrR family transcriptional regulator [Labrenzia sp. EL_195]MBG6197460.1 AcrR family transcriptional regulator [Labrenzia sp. EL_159]
MSRKKARGVTRNEILDRAWDLISEKGADISMSQIAAESRVSRQSVYLHFKTRGGLLLALVQRADERFEVKEGFFSALEIEDPAQRLDECLKVWFEFAVKIHPVATDLIRLRKTDDDANTAWTDRMADLRTWERQLVQSLADDGALSNDWQVDDAADFLWASTSIQIWDILYNDRSWNAAKISGILRRSVAKTLLH